MNDDFLSNTYHSTRRIRQLTMFSCQLLSILCGEQANKLCFLFKYLRFYAENTPIDDYFLSKRFSFLRHKYANGQCFLVKYLRFYAENTPTDDVFLSNTYDSTQRIRQCTMIFLSITYGSTRRICQQRCFLLKRFQLYAVNTPTGNVFLPTTFNYTQGIPPTKYVLLSNAYDSTLCTPTEIRPEYTNAQIFLVKYVRLYAKNTPTNGDLFNECLTVYYSHFKNITINFNK